jgi:hypothetical protein
LIFAAFTAVSVAAHFFRDREKARPSGNNRRQRPRAALPESVEKPLSSNLFQRVTAYLETTCRQDQQ